MTDQPTTARLIRLYVDDELPADERADFEARLAEDAALADLVAAERRLAERVAVVMGGVAPADVRARVREALHAESRPAATRSWFAGPIRANAFAVAASLTLVAGAVLFGIFGRPIDSLTAPSPTVEIVSEAAQHASSEHTRCAMDADARDAKMRYRSLDALCALFSQELGTALPVLDLEAEGYRFVGGGPCAVPGSAWSGHLMYSKVGSAAKASIFVVRNVGQFDAPDASMTPGAWYRTEGGPGCRHKVVRSTDGELVYLLVCCFGDDREGVATLITGQCGGAAPPR